MNILLNMRWHVVVESEWYNVEMTDLKCEVLKFSVLEGTKKKCKVFFITCRRKANLYLLAFCNDIIQILPINKK